MTFQDLKLTCINSLVLAISFSDIEQTLKIALLIISIVYTTLKCIEFINTKFRRRNDNDKSSDE